MNVNDSRAYLNKLINRTLRIRVSDDRMFVGMFKCTDNERNIILSQAFEYREPPAAVVNAAREQHLALGKPGPFAVDLTSRFMGLVVVPGKHILSIEVETE